MESSAIDYLNFRKDKKLMELFSSSEQLQYTGNIKKINDHGKTQIRSIVITNEKIYNFEGKKIKRAVFLKDVEGLYIN